MADATHQPRNFLIIGVLAIVAIVGLVILVSSGKERAGTMAETASKSDTLGQAAGTPILADDAPPPSDGNQLEGCYVTSNVRGCQVNCIYGTGLYNAVNLHCCSGSRLCTAGYDRCSCDGKPHYPQ